MAEAVLTTPRSAPELRPHGAAAPAPGPWTQVRALGEMTKARLSSLVLVTAASGYALGLPDGLPLSYAQLGWLLLGTAFAAFGANALNQCLERHHDAAMERTRGRPLPSGRVGLPLALVWSLSLLCGGTALLALRSGSFAAVLALAVGVLYVAAYTPLKRRTSLATLVGAVCGALPPLIGWAAASGGELGPGAWVLFAILFVWQIPHFLAIDWYYRDDYRSGGYRMVSGVDASGRFGGYLTVLYSLALLPITLLAPRLGLGGALYLAGAVGLGLGLVALSVLLWVRRDRAAARGLFLGSIVYLPLLLGLLVLDPAPL
ncbi:MAG: protoheme IX farnesyltransferase [Planctomycetota bacterium]|nr:MAG: protoheme IX farnesyltransferase [Planctomycetota bacterium]